MKIAEIKIGQSFRNTKFDKIFIVTSVTATRVNCDDFRKFTTSTGRSSSKFFLGVKSFQERLDAGEFVAI